MKSEKIKDWLIGLLCVLLQMIIFRHLRIFGTEADIILIYIIWLMSTKDRTTAVLFAAVLGFAQDALLDLWGLNMFSKTLLAFAGYQFIPKTTESKLLNSQVFLIVMLAAMFHNIIFLGLSSFAKLYVTQYYVWIYLVGNSFYTAVVASVVYLFKDE